MSADQTITSTLPITQVTRGFLEGEGRTVPEAEVPFDLSTVPVLPKHRKVALIGYTMSQRQAPWDDPGWCIVGMNNLHTLVQNTRWDAWFDLHDAAMIDSDPQHLEWLGQRHPFPIFMMNPRPEFPSAVPFPKDELVARFGTYFTNTVSWQVAWAITQVEWARGDGAEIGVWGVDMAQGTEYAAQRPSCEYFIGLARGLGIDVTVAETSDLLKTASIYGDPAGQALYAKLTERIGELQERLTGVRREIAQAMDHVGSMRAAENQLVGSLETCQYITGTWFPPAVGPGSTRTANDVRAGKE